MLEQLKKMDWGIVLIVLILMGMGTALIYSASIGANGAASTLYVKNLLNFALAFVVFFFFSMLDYRLFLKYWYVLYGAGAASLVAVYFFGHESHGARSWFQLPLGFNFQPAELEKVILILSIAGFIALRRGRRLALFHDVLPIGLLTFIPFVLVLIQPDLGNAVIYIIILLGMLWIGNIKYIYVLVGGALIVLMFVGFYFFYTSHHDQIKTFLAAHHAVHWADRIDTYLNPKSVPAWEAYQVTNSKIAIGSGGLKGEGYLKGHSVHRGLIPLAVSDSIFVVIGEEFGFLGGAVLLLIYFMLLYRMILISIQTSDLSGSIMIIGVISMFVFQIFENIGMLIGITPLTGITLPFISYGGTSVMINMMSLGLVNSIKLHREELPEF